MRTLVAEDEAAPRDGLTFGDGRRFKRTVAGNSLHYVLDVEGRPIDALPGLYAPKTFVRELEGAIAVAREAGGRSPRRARRCSAPTTRRKRR